MASLVAELRDGGYAIHSVEREFVVHDDHEALDRGWIDEAAARMNDSGEYYGRGDRT
ncbi:hypothetical protein ACU686_43175 [Yinghuangia aomiensis]